MIFSSSAEAYEKVSLKAMESWLSDMSIPLYIVGPLLPPNYGMDTASLGIGGNIEFKTFLDAMFSQYREHSVLFVWLPFLSRIHVQGSHLQRCHLALLSGWQSKNMWKKLSRLSFR